MSDSKAFIMAILVVATVLSLGYAYLLDTDNRELNEGIAKNQADLERLTSTCSVKDNRIDELDTMLTLKETELNSALQKVEEETAENKDLQSDMSQLKSEIDSTIIQIEDYRENVQESMEWFSINSELPTTDTFKDYRRELESFCLQNNDDDCSIKLPCIALINNLKRGLEYKTDEENADEVDKLLDLESIISHGGGDCEDFSLLAVAEINYMKEKCFKDKLLFESYTDGAGTYKVDFKEDYIVKKAQPVPIPEEKINYAVICGTFPRELNVNNVIETEAGGHCLLGFSEIEIKDSSDIVDFLSSSVMVEPQSGRYVYDERIAVPISGKPEGQFYLFMVMTDHDLYTYMYKEGEYLWTGYSDLLDDIENKISDLVLFQRKVA